MVYCAYFLLQLEAILATEEPSAFLLSLVQGLVSAFGGEPGEWSVLKESLKVFLLSMLSSASAPSPVSLISVDFNGDDGNFIFFNNCNLELIFFMQAQTLPFPLSLFGCVFKNLHKPHQPLQ